MSREDALLWSGTRQRNKLRRQRNLAAIMTLGFKWRAVPSILVSRFRLVTTDAVDRDGSPWWTGKEMQTCGMPGAPGTVIERFSFQHAGLSGSSCRQRAPGGTTWSISCAYTQRHSWAEFSCGRMIRGVLICRRRRVDRVRQLLGPELAGTDRATANAWHQRDGAGHPAASETSVTRKGGTSLCFLNGRPVEDAVISRALAEDSGGLADGLLRRRGCGSIWNRRWSV
jgi:hypothetical protein